MPDVVVAFQASILALLFDKTNHRILGMKLDISVLTFPGQTCRTVMGSGSSPQAATSLDSTHVLIMLGSDLPP